MYELIRGPGMWFSVLVTCSGICFRIISFIRASRRVTKSIQVIKPVPHNTQAGPVSLKSRFSIMGKGTFSGRNPVFFMLTLFFHVLVIVVPIGVQAHGVLFFQSWRVRVPSFSGLTADMLTVFALIASGMLMVRRIVLPHVRIITSVTELLVMAVTMVPFITGYLAYHQIGPYHGMIIAHMLSGQVLMISLGWTRTGHMLFMIFTRFFIRSEYSLVPASRQWSC